MSKMKKAISVLFFSIEAKDYFFNNFISNVIANVDNALPTRVFNVRDKKYLLKTSMLPDSSGRDEYFITVVRERNTWQVKASRDGKISGTASNQGIIGDPYFFFVAPKEKILLGFTSGPNGSLKGVGKALLEQFNYDRGNSIRLNFIPKEKEFSTLKELPEYSSLHFKINSSSLSDVSDDAPKLIRDLSSAPYIESNMQLALDLVFDESSKSDFSKDNLLEIVSYLSEHDGCTVLKVKGVSSDGSPISLDFGNAFYNYRTEIQTRQKFIDEESSIKVLDAAMLDYRKSFRS
ncbi:hypothetical protein ACP6EV_20940 [Aeromonas hydrophila]|uniref:hypothetical protein n=1 Tax=Aeromonas hydrophila TaxID=644 RepID=UPI003CEAA5C8